MKHTQSRQDSYETDIEARQIVTSSGELLDNVCIKLHQYCFAHIYRRTYPC